jgi:hypothetical protein
MIFVFRIPHLRIERAFQTYLGLTSYLPENWFYDRKSQNQRRYPSGSSIGAFAMLRKFCHGVGKCLYLESRRCSANCYKFLYALCNRIAQLLLSST